MWNPPPFGFHSINTSTGFVKCVMTANSILVSSALHRVAKCFCRTGIKSVQAFLRLFKAGLFRFALERKDMAPYASDYRNVDGDQPPTIGCRAAILASRCGKVLGDTIATLETLPQLQLGQLIPLPCAASELLDNDRSASSVQIAHRKMLCTACRK
jgi:hypothetical protein